MDIIARYTMIQFLRSSLGFVTLLAFLGWLVQLLRSIDLVTSKGQTILTMLAQSLLVIPEIVSIVLFICAALGISRSLSAMQRSSELFPVHSSGSIRSLAQALVLFLLLGAGLDLVLRHHFVPLANQTAAKRSDEINADLIANSSRPGRFTEVAPGVTMMIESRDRNGIGRGFFLYDERDRERSRLFIAGQSRLSQAEDDMLFIRLQDGILQYYTYETGQLTTIEFREYQVFVRELAQSNLFATVEPTSLELIALSLANAAPSNMSGLLHARSASMLYIIGLGIFAFSLTMSPGSGRSRRKTGVDVVVLAVGVIIKVVGSASAQLAGVSEIDNLVFYAIPLLPLAPALILFWRNGLFSRLPASLRGGR